MDSKVKRLSKGEVEVVVEQREKVVEMPKGFKLMASTESAPIADIADEDRKFYGLQFHPEVNHTEHGG